MSEDVKFKGSRSGLQLVLNDTASFSDIERELKTKLESSLNFFCKGTVVKVIAGVLKKEEQDRLAELFHGYGLILRLMSLETEKAQEKKIIEKKEPEEEIPGLHDMTVIDKTIRGGQEVVCNGSILICGNVNPGSQVIAGGNIDIRGTCRGIVHAGAFGDTKAIIVADHMMPMQVRIAELIARAPDDMEKSKCTERAYIKNGQIVIEPIER